MWDLSDVVSDAEEVERAEIAIHEGDYDERASVLLAIVEGDAEVAFAVSEETKLPPTAEVISIRFECSNTNGDINRVRRCGLPELDRRGMEKALFVAYLTVQISFRHSGIDRRPNAVNCLA